MREYSKVSPLFWTGKTGKYLRQGGPEATIVGMYLLTNQHANWLGFYYLPLAYIVNDTGIPLEGALKGLRRAIEGGFCEYDFDSEYIWIKKMALYQIEPQLKPQDNRVKSITKHFLLLPDTELLRGFYAFYKDKFHLQIHPYLLDNPEAPPKGLGKPLRSQEQEQEQVYPAPATKDKSFVSGAGVIRKANDAQPGVKKTKNKPVPYDEITQAYHEQLPMLKPVYKLTDTRKKKIQALARDELDTVDAWKNYFADIAQSKFLTGRGPPKNGDGRAWVADFDFIIEASNFVKIAEGKYHDQKIRR